MPFSCHNLFVEGASSSRHCSLGMSSSGAGMTDSALDVTVTGPLARTNARVAAAEAGSSLSKVFDRKVQRAAAACQQQGLVFLPLAVETLGGMHKVEVRTAQAPGSSRGSPSGLI